MNCLQIGNRWFKSTSFTFVRKEKKIEWNL